MIFDITKLNRSSFRGVPFYTNSTNLSSGHRLTDHTFINNGTKTEDNGLQNKTFSITGYIGGEDYLTVKSDIINALDVLDDGILIDKFYGTLTVKVESYSVNEEISKLGMATINMTFKKSENNLVIKTLTNYNLDYEDVVFDNFRNKYDPFLGEEILNDVANGIKNIMQKVEDCIKFLEDARDFVQDVKSTIGKTISRVKSSVLSVSSLIDEIISIASSFDKVLSLDSFGAKQQNSLTNGIRESMNSVNRSSFDSSIDEIANKQIKLFTYTLNALLIQTCIKNLDNVTFSTGDNFGSCKNDILTVMELLESDIVSSLDEDITKIVTRKNLLDKYQESKKIFVQIYTQKYSGLQNLQDTDIIATTDILTLTMDRYNDISRVDEVIENNDILDPLFINGNIRLLDR